MLTVCVGKAGKIILPCHGPIGTKNLYFERLNVLYHLSEVCIETIVGTDTTMCSLTRY